MSDETKNDLPVESEDTADIGIGDLADLVSDQSIPAPIRKNFLKALDRLFCAAIDIPVEWLERGPVDRRSTSEERIKFRQAVTNQLIQQIETDPEFTRRASRTFAHGILRDRFNLEKVFGFAKNILKKKKYDNSANQLANTEEGQTISEDWFNIFEKEASQKSTEDMQRRFAKVLAGEIEKPGSHSIKAVKALGNMDQATAELFQRLCSMSVVLEDSFDTTVYDIRVPSLGGNPGQNDLQKYGLSFEQIIMLIEYDLVAANYDTWYDYKACILNTEKNVANPFQHQGRYWILKPSPERLESNEFRLSGVRLSYVGFQLFHIVERIPMQQYTKDLKEYFEKQKLEMTEVSIYGTGQNRRWRIIPR